MKKAHPHCVPVPLDFLEQYVIDRGGNVFRHTGKQVQGITHDHAASDLRHYDPFFCSRDARPRIRLVTNANNSGLQYTESIFLPNEALQFRARSERWFREIAKANRTTHRNFQSRPRAAIFTMPPERLCGNWRENWYSIYNVKNGHWIFHGTSLAARVFHSDTFSTFDKTSSSFIATTQHSHRMQQLTFG